MSPARSKPSGKTETCPWCSAKAPVEEELGGKIEAPSAEVRREMLRLELAAIDAELEAKATQAAAQRDLPPEDAAEPNAS